MIGKIYKARTPYYDCTTNSTLFKARPALVLAQADGDDYVVLPVSSITIKANIDPVYDIKLDPALYPELHLKNVSYVRTHKQTIVHRANLRDQLSDVRSDYPDLYLHILAKREAFSHSVSQQAIS